MANNINPIALVGHVQQQAELGRQQGERRFVQRMTPAVIGGDPQAFAQVAAIDPAAANTAQAQGDDQLLRAKGLIDFLEKADAQNPQAAQQAWVQYGIPYVRQFANGAEPTADWQQAKGMLSGLKAKIAQAEAARGAQVGSSVQSQFVGADGQRYALMRDGSVQPLGIGADVRTQVVEGPGGRFLIDQRAGTASPVTLGQAPAQGGGDYIDPTLPPEVQAALRANPQAAAAIPDGGALPMPQPQAGGAPTAAQAAGSQLGNAPRATSASDTESFGQPQTVIGPDGRPRLVQFGNRGGEREVGGYGAAPEGKAATAKEIADATARRLKAPQITNLERGLQNIDRALANLGDNMIGTGPATGGAIGLTQEGQALETAVGSIQNSLLALTRVPGIGAQSDLEARIAALQYPQTGNYAENNRMLVANLRALVDDIKFAYDSLREDDDAIIASRRRGGVGGEAGGGSQGAPVRRATNPQTGETLILVNGQWVPE